MVLPEDVPRVVRDAARLARSGQLIVFGSSALAFWLEDAPESRDVDIAVLPEEHGHPVEALMGELSWYQERHDVYVEVLPPETFTAPMSWPARARTERMPDAPDVEITVPHPHDIMMAKLERFESHDREHARRILRAFPLDGEDLASLAEQMPHRTGAITDPRRQQRFEGHLVQLAAMLGAD